MNGVLGYLCAHKQIMNYGYTRGSRSSLERVITIGEVGAIFRLKKCLLYIWEAMKGDAYMHFAVTPLIPLFNKLV